MRILFDHVTPRGIARSLMGHAVTKAKDRGWACAIGKTWLEGLTAFCVRICMMGHPPARRIFL